MEYTAQQLSQQLGGTLLGDGAARISGVNALEAAEPGQLTFAEHVKYATGVAQTRASAILVPPDFPETANRTLIRVANPRAAFLQVMYLFYVPPAATGIVHPSAVVSSEAVLAEGVTIQEAVIVRARARIGQGTVIESGVHVGEAVVIGRDCFIGPNVVLMYGVRLGDRVIIHGGTVIGGDGFGYVQAQGRHIKIPQVGSVVIEDDVEIGCNVCVDRATFGATIIKRGTKIDNLVQIAHNDVIGEDVIITGQVGLAGSVTVGNHVMFGGQSGVVDHITIGEGARIGAATPVTKDVKAGESVWGFPARPHQQVLKELASITKLPDLLRQMRAMRRRVEQLETQLQIVTANRKIS